MKYNVGDKVRIKSLDWYNENKTKHGDVCFDNAIFVGGQSLYCGCELTIRLVTDDSYYVIENNYYWTDEMIEGLAKDEMPLDIDGFQDDNEMGDVIDEYVHRLKDNECQINLPEGYIFKDENGNVINAQKIILEKKGKEYPKTYEECLSILEIYNGLPDVEIYNAKPSECTLFESFIRLKRCRDAYWKIAGEEMGLGKPWEPDWENDDHESYPAIVACGGKIIKSSIYTHDNPFAFPTEEMRDAFYENFKELINECKELL